MNVQLYSDALGLAILQEANRYLLLSTTGARVVVAAIWAVGLAALLPLRFTARRQRAGLVLTVALGSVSSAGRHGRDRRRGRQQLDRPLRRRHPAAAVQLGRRGDRRTTDALHGRG